MKKFIFVIDAIKLIMRLKAGERIEGVLFFDKEAQVVTFKAWNRTAPKHRKERKIADLDYGWIGLTDKHITRREKFPLSMGLGAVMSAMERDNNQSKQAVVDEYIIDCM